MVAGSKQWVQFRSINGVESSSALLSVHPLQPFNEAAVKGDEGDDVQFRGKKSAAPELAVLTEQH